MSVHKLSTMECIITTRRGSYQGELLNEKVVLVSGGTQGVGAGIVRAAARVGAQSPSRAAGPTRADRLVAELGSDVASFVQADLADPEQALGSVRTVVEHYGRIDFLVNSAGLTTGAHSSTPPRPCSTLKLP